MPILAIPQNAAVEVLGMRTAKSKTWRNNDGSHTLSASIAEVHFPDANGVLQDIDWTLDATGSPKNARHSLKPLPNKVGYTYSHKATGEKVVVELIQVGSTLAKDFAKVAPVIAGTDVTWSEVVPGVDVIVRSRMDGAELHTVINNAQAPRSFVVRHTQDANTPNVNVDPTATGNDASGNPPNPNCEITQSTTAPSADGQGHNVFDTTYTWTGNVKVIDPVTRVRSWSATAVVYPVDIDPTITVQVSTDADDGWESGNSTWTSNGSTDRFGSYSGTQYNGGWRFASVSVPPTATISSASLTLDISLLSGGHVGAGQATLWGNKVANAAALSGSNRPSQLTKTTASTAMPVSTTGSQVFSCTSIMSEIVGQGSWANGNAVTLFSLGTTGVGSNYAQAVDYHATPANAAQLSVTYTAPAWLIQSTSQAATSPTGTMTATYTSNTTAGTLLVASVSVKGLTSGITVTDNVNGTWATAANSNFVNFLGPFYFANGAGGAVTVTLHGLTGAAAASISISEWGGVITVSPVDASNGANDGSGSATNTGSGAPVTSTQTNDLYICAVQLATNSTGLSFTNPSTGVTQLYSQTNVLDGIQDAEWFINATASNVLPTWSWTTGQPFQTYTVAFKTTSGGASPVPPSISIPDFVLKDTSDSYRAEGYAAVGTGINGLGLAFVGRGAGEGGRQPPPIQTPKNVLGDISAGEHYGFSQVLGAQPLHFVAVNQLLSEPNYALGDSSYYDGSSQFMYGLPIYHHKFGSVAPVVAIGHSDYSDGFTETLRAQPFRQIIPPPPPNNVRPPVNIREADSTNTEGVGMIVAPGALKPGLARPKLIPTTEVLGDVTNTEGFSTTWHGTPPLGATGSHAMSVLVGDQTSFDGAISIAVHGASYRQPVQPFEPVFVIGDQTNQEGMTETPALGARKNFQFFNPPKIVIGDQQYADGFVVEMGPWEDQNKHPPAEPITVFGHQDYVDGLAFRLGAQPYHTSDPLPAVLAAFGEQPTSIGMSDGQAFLPLHGRVWHVVAPIEPNCVLGDQTLQEAILGVLATAQPMHRNILAPAVFVLGDQTSYDGQVEVPLQGMPHTQPVPNPTVNASIGDQSFTDGLPQFADSGAPLHQVQQTHPAFSLGDQTDVLGSSLVLSAIRHTQHILAQEPIVAVLGNQDYFDGQSQLAPALKISQRAPFIAVQSVLADQTNLDGIAQLSMGTIYARASVRSVLSAFVDQDVIVPLSDHNYTQVLYAQPSRGSSLPPVGLPDAIWLTTKRDTVFKFDPNTLWWQITVMRD